MKPTRYVNESSNKLARAMEIKFAILPPEAGIIFISIEAQPEFDGISKEYEIRLGLDRRYSKETGMALVKKILEEELATGISFSANVSRGIPGMVREHNSFKEIHEELAS